MRNTAVQLQRLAPQRADEQARGIPGPGLLEVRTQIHRLAGVLPDTLDVYNRSKLFLAWDGDLSILRTRRLS